MEKFKKGQLVLCRDSDKDLWLPFIYHNENYVMWLSGNRLWREWRQIIPFNESLMGTANSPEPQPEEGEWWMVKRSDDGTETVMMCIPDGWDDGMWRQRKGITPLYRMIPDKQ